jgi:putative DNA primase/helicase
MTTNFDIARVAKALLGAPNSHLSGKTEWRYGSRGSLSVDLTKNVWHDHEANTGGGVLDLINRELGGDRADAQRWHDYHFGAPHLDRPGLGKPKSNGATHQQAGRIVATYDYVDERGAVLFQVVRFEPKDFRQRRPDGEGGWIWNLDSIQRTLYRLLELREAVASDHVIFIVEGEKDVESLRKLNIVATTCPGGANKWRPEYNQFFAGADVVVISDADEPGREHAKNVAAQLAAFAKRIRLIELPAKDASDWLLAGGTAEKLWALVEETSEWNGANKSGNSEKSETDRQANNGTCSAEQRRPKGKTSTFLRLSAILPLATDWLWLHRIPRGAQIINTGLPGTGKSQQLIDVVAHVTTGTPWPDGQPCPCGDAILLTAEDQLATTVKPRLMAAGANCDRVFTLPAIHLDAKSSRAFLLTEDLDELDRRLVERPETLLVGIDPVTAYMGAGKIDSHKTADVRGVLGPLAALAEKHNVAIYTITHPPKASTQAINAFIGSQAFIAAARVGYLTVQEIDDERRPTGRSLVTMVKTNFGPQMPTLAYRLAQIAVGDDHRDGRTIIGSHVVWERDPVIITADQALAAAAGKRKDTGSTAKDDGIEFLQVALGAGPRSVRDLEAEARDAGLLPVGQPISQCKPIRAARDALGVKVYQLKGQKAGGWFCALPHQMSTEWSDALQNERASDGVEGI